MSDDRAAAVPSQAREGGVAAQAESAAARPSSTTPQWVPMKSRKPPFKQDVLAIDHDIGGAPRVVIACLFEGAQGYNDTWAVDSKAWVEEPTYHNITHWMPLPEAI